REFFRTGYPDMRSVEHNVAVAERAGYKVLATHLLPPGAWAEGYYDILGPRAKALLGHPDPAVREFAAETVREIEVFQCSDGSYGYVFFVLQRAEPAYGLESQQGAPGTGLSDSSFRKIRSA